MLMPTLVFVCFAVISATGAYLILAHHRGTKAAIIGGTLTLLFFVALFAGVLALIRSFGAP